MTGRWLTYRTTGKRPALRLVSRFYGIGYNALVVACGRRLVLAVLLRLNSRLPPFWQAFRSRLPYSIVKVLLFFQFNHPTKASFVICDNLAGIWLIPTGGTD